MSSLDQLATQINRGEIDLDAITTGLQQTKGTTRRVLRNEPSSMLQILNAIDGIEQEIINFIQSINRGK